MHAEQPAQPHGDEPGGKQRRAHGETHIPYSDEASYHRDVYRTAQLQRKFHKDDLPRKGNYGRILCKNTENRRRENINQQVQAFRYRDGRKHGAPNARPHGAELVAANEVPNHDLRCLRDGYGIKVHGVCHHVAVNFCVDCRRAEPVHELHDGKLRKLVRKRFAAAGEADGERAAQLPHGEGLCKQAGQEARICAFIKEYERKGEAHNLAHIRGNCSARCAEARETAKAVDEQRVEADVECVHYNGGQQHFFYKAIAAQNGAYEHVCALHRKAEGDEARVFRRFGDERIRHADEAEQRLREKQQYGGKQQPKEQHEQCRNRADNAHTPFVPCAEGLRSKHGCTRAEHVKHENGDVDDLVRIADRTNGIL